MLNDKWVGVDTIIERLGRSFPGLSVSRGHAAEWCFDVVKDLGAWPSFKEERGLVIEVENNRADLPCNVYRVLSVLPDRGGLTSSQREGFKYSNMGSHLLFGSNNITNVTRITIDALVFEVDEQGLPLIYERAAEAAFYYILKRLKEGEFLSGKMPADRWQWITMEYDRHMHNARSSMRFMTRQELDSVVRVARSTIRPAHYAIQ